MNRVSRAAALAGAASLLVLTGCGQAASQPGATSASAGGGEPADVTACLVTGVGGTADRSLDQAAYEGLTALEAAGDLGGVTLLESSSPADFFPHLARAAGSGCGITVAVGPLLAEATTEAARQHPDQQFVLVDSPTAEPLGNLRSVLFDTAQAAHLAGYVAAGTSRTGTVATFADTDLPPTTATMDGFAGGVAAYNAARGADVRLLGWDPAAQDGAFTGELGGEAAGRTLAEGFIREGADVIMPVAGDAGLGAAAAAQAVGDVRVVWVGEDGYELAPRFAPLFLTSVVKGVSTAVVDVTGAALDGSLSDETYVGTLGNGGVGIAPYHDSDPLVPQQLAAEVEALRERIASGDLVVDSPSSPRVVAPGAAAGAGGEPPGEG